MKIRQINLDGLDLISNDYNFTVEGLFNFDKDIVTNNLYTNGSSFNSSKLQSKKLLLNGFIKTNDINKIIELNKILIPNSLKTLTLTIDVLRIVKCEVEIQNRSAGKNSKILSCQLIMPDPCFYSSEAEIIELGSISNNGVVYPVIYPITFGNITGAEGVIANVGTVKNYPVITIVGTCSNIAITNQTTGESMSLNVSLLDSDTLIIDNRISTRGIYLNGVKRIDLKNGSWLSCAVGDNQFSFSRTSLQSTKKHCTIELQSRWI